MTDQTMISRPGGHRPEPTPPPYAAANYTRLCDALSGITLSPDEQRTLRWLSSWETYTCDRIAGIIRRARESGS